MTEKKSFVLGQMEFPIGSFTIGQVQSLIPLFFAGGMESVSSASSMITAIYQVVKVSEPDLTFEEFQKIPDASVGQMLTAFQKIGLAIGYFQPKALPAPGIGGEASGHRN